jgi:hypothetical protein
MIDFKYKPGDKLVCFQDFFLEPILGDTISPEPDYVVGDMITIKSVYAKSNTPFPIYGDYKGEEHLFTIKEITDNFISIAEWRDNQINSILND